MSLDQQLLSAFDGHNAEGIRTALAAGASATRPVHGKKPVYWLLEEYTRSDRLPECLSVLLDAGAILDDELLVPVLLDDSDAIGVLYNADRSILDIRTSLASSFTSMIDVTLLHVAAEYGHLNAARKLIELGADVNAIAGFDEYSLNGHTPIFHTVNSNANRSAPIMHMLLEAGARCDVRLDGLDWDKVSVGNNILRRHPHLVRTDRTNASGAQERGRHLRHIRAMLEASGRKMPPLHNLPNRYLRPKSNG